MRVKSVLITSILLAVSAGYSIAADISTHSFTSCALPDTGQTVSYTATFGEDHDYMPARSQQGYTVYNPVGTSSVTVDNRTGLMWVTNPVDAGISGTYTWENAITACETTIGAAGTYAGYSDWRLPNIKELSSIVDYSRQSPAINTTYFLNAQNAACWSSTTYLPSTPNAWYVGVIAGNASATTKTDLVYIRCVRGGP